MTVGVRTSTPGRASAASFVGSLTEYYDFFIYGTAAALVFNGLFFSELSPAVGTLLAFATFSVGYLVRPVGGIVFGHIGDRYGRRRSLLITLLMMGLGTFLIGCLPTFSQIGEAAPVLLILLRLIQGLAVGGELGGAVGMAVEHAPRNRRGFFGSFSMAGAFAGLVLSSAVVGPLTLMSDEAFLAWGWRIPFLLSAVVVGIGFVIRRTVGEPPVFEESLREGRIEPLPLLTTVRRYWRQVLVILMIWSGPNTILYLVTVFGLSVATTTYGVPRTTMLWLVGIAATVLVVSAPLWGALSDRVGRKWLLAVGVPVEAGLLWLFFLSLPTGDPWVILVAMTALLGLGHGIITGISPAFSVEMFPTELRCTAVSLGQQLASVVGGFAPVIAVALSAGDRGLAPIAVYVTVLCVLGALSVAFLVKDLIGTDLGATEPEPGDEVSSDAAIA
ncbi:MFS transporter [Pseudonocardia sp. NPDC049154]|uniref:MFS transporter n=1 Tax=Pseudonocardia sp. NPDC049154 TaxID=3155501 RepID=UPI0033E66074